MQAFTSPLTNPSIQYVFAFIIVTLAGVIVYLYHQITTLAGKIETIQNARLQDAKEMTDKVTMPLSSISQTIALIYDKLKDGR